MYLAEAAEIFTFWERHPPPYHTIAVIAQMLGWTPETRRSGDTAAEQLFAAPPPGLALARGGTGLPEPIFTVDAMRTRNWAWMAERARG
jgi:hypothetical protein